MLAFDVVVLGEREVHGNGLGAGAHLERNVVVVQEQPKLLQVVRREQVGPRQGRLVSPRAGDEAVTQPRIGSRHGVGVNANDRIARANPVARRLAQDERLQGNAQVVDARAIDFLHSRQSRGSVVETHGCKEGGALRHVNRPW